MLQQPLPAVRLQHQTPAARSTCEASCEGRERGSPAARHGLRTASARHGPGPPPRHGGLLWAYLMGLRLMSGQADRPAGRSSWCTRLATTTGSMATAAMAARTSRAFGPAHMHRDGEGGGRADVEVQRK